MSATATARRPRKTATPAAVLHDPEAPAVVQAAQIAFKVMAAAKADTWEDVGAADHIRSLVQLTQQQQEILDEHRAVLPYLVRRGLVVTVIGCTTCDRFVFVDSKTSTGTRCSATLGCDGSPVKASTTGYRRPKELGATETTERVA